MMENVWDAARELATPYSGSGYFRKDFKSYWQSLPENKQPVEDKEKGYEIMEVEYCGQRRILVDGEYRVYPRGIGFDLKYMIDNSAKIISVLRKNDNYLIELNKTKVIDPNTNHAWIVSDIFLKEDKVYLNGVWLNHVKIFSTTNVISNDSIKCQNEEKPPIGLMPKFIWIEQRIWDIAIAIERYQNGNKEIPQEWINEDIELRKQLSTKK